MAIAPEQCRAARAWLGWSRRDLAAHAQVSASTIRDFEAGQRIPIPNNRKAIQLAFERAGVEFLFTEQNVGLGITKPPPVGSVPKKGRRRSKD